MRSVVTRVTGRQPPSLSDRRTVPGGNDASRTPTHRHPPSTRPRRGTRSRRPRRRRARGHDLDPRRGRHRRRHLVAGVQRLRRQRPRLRRLELRHRGRRLGQRRAAELHDVPQQLRARRAGQPRHHRPPRGRRVVHVRAAAEQQQVRGEVRPRRGPHPDPARSGHLAGVLDARRRLPPDGVAVLGRDRHHGERRQGAAPHLRHGARPRLLRRQRHHRRVPAPAELVVRGHLPHVRRGLEARLDHVVRRRRTSSTRSRPPASAATRGCSTRPTSSSSTSPSAASGRATRTARPSSRSR